MSGRFADGLHIDRELLLHVLEVPEGASLQAEALAEIGRSLSADYGQLPPWHSETTIDVVEYASGIACNVDGGEIVLEHTLLFDLARYLQSTFVARCRHTRSLRDDLTPYVVLFVHCLLVLEILPLTGADRIDWEDQEQVEHSWRNAWGKVKFAQGENLLQRTVELARECPLKLKKPVRGEAYHLLLTFAYILQMTEGPEKDILLPVHTVAKHLGRSHVTVNDMIATAIEDEYLECVDPTYRLGKAKRYRFRLRHPNLKEKHNARA